jgi:HD-GYP domain-containing protein (c-di-GMP phosphodiesterase class II)
VARLSDLVRKQSINSQDGGDTTSWSEAVLGASERESPLRWYAVARQEVRRVGETVRLNERLRIEGVADLAKQVVQAVQQGDEYVRWGLKGQTDDYLVDNALHVAVVGVKIGIGLHYSDEELTRLAMAGLLHDVGMWTLPASLIEKAGPLTEEERDALHAHPERGRRILANLGSSYEWLSTISAQEHERWDGSGYPCKLRGAQIAEQAQIIGVADVFDAMITERPYRKRIAPHQALRELLVHAKGTFSHCVLKTLADQITLYPVGTGVRLNTGEIGTVTKVNPRYPLRPILTISKPSGEASELDLSQAVSTHIVEVLQSVTV